MFPAPAPARHALLVHPASQPGPVRVLEVAARRHRGAVRPSAELELTYAMHGDVARLQLPEPRAPVRADGLWRHTCFEAFIRCGGREYWEYNLSPSGAWAAYHFTGYREGMTAQLEGAPPQIQLRIRPDSLELTARLDLDWLARSAASSPLELALAAVVEDDAHVLSYWALAHPAEKPDFHHADGFVLTLD
jgi:hypothetical protein